LHLRERDTGQGLHLMAGYPGAVVINFLLCYGSGPICIKRAAAELLRSAVASYGSCLHDLDDRFAGLTDGSLLFFQRLALRIFL